MEEYQNNLEMQSRKFQGYIIMFYRESQLQAQKI